MSGQAEARSDSTIPTKEQGRPASGELEVSVAGAPWAGLVWGDRAAPPVVLLHGLASSAATFWRIGPAIAARGRYVVAFDLPGHGRTGWLGRPRFADVATDVATAIGAARLDGHELVVVGHSWGAVVSATVPAVGLRPRTLVLLDPPALTISELEALTDDPEMQRYTDIDEARRVVRAGNPDWASGDIEAKADALCRCDPQAIRAILRGNGDWDAGLGSLQDPASAGLPTWLVRGAPDAGGMIPDAVAGRVEARLGADHLITLSDCGHSPHRTHPGPTLEVIIAALDS